MVKPDSIPEFFKKNPAENRFCGMNILMDKRN